MTEFIVELYVPRDDCAAVTAAVAGLTAAGVQVVRAIFVPADETCLLLVEAPGRDDVLEAARRAAVRLDHVAEISPEDLTTTRRAS